MPPDPPPRDEPRRWFDGLVNVDQFKTILLSAAFWAMVALIVWATWFARD